MNWEHFKAIVWLRDRLFRNRLRRSGMANTVVTTIVLGLALLSSVAMFFVALLVGVKTLPYASPDQVLYLWNVVIGAVSPLLDDRPDDRAAAVGSDLASRSCSISQSR